MAERETHADNEWEFAKDRELDEMTDQQLIYEHDAIAVTLEERGYYLDRDLIWQRRAS